jgi:quercetin dioxygenase-like cupin family protein
MDSRRNRHFSREGRTEIMGASLQPSRPEPTFKEAFEMFDITRRGSFRSLLGASVVAAALTFSAGIANAGECPANQMSPGALTSGATAPVDVSDKLLASIDLAKEKTALKDHLFRMRQLEIKPGGVVPWHSHAERPALIYVVKGEILEYASNCKVPIVHKAGEVSIEKAGVAHWWKNVSNETVILISADILRDHADKNM